MPEVEKWAFWPFLRDFKAVEASNTDLMTWGALEIVQKVKDLVFWPFSAEIKHIYLYPHAIFLLF